MNNPNLHSLNVNPPGRTRSSQASIQGGPPSVLEWDSEEEPFVMEPSGDLVPNTLHVVKDNFHRSCCSSPSRKFIDQGKSLTSGDSGSTTAGTVDCGMGATCDQLGQKAQGEEILRRPQGRFGLLRVEPCSLHQSSSRSTRLCEVLPGGSEPLSLAGGPVDFHQEVLTAKEQLNRFKSSHPFRSLKKTIKSIDRIEKVGKCYQ